MNKELLIKILKITLIVLWTIFLYTLKTLGFILMIIFKSSQKASKGYYKEVEETGKYSGFYD